MRQSQFSPEEILASNSYMTVENQAEITTLVSYITYCVEWDLFELCRADCRTSGLEWDDFVMLMRRHKPLRDAAVTVVRDTLKDFYNHGHYNFDVAEVALTFSKDAKGGADDTLHCSSLFSGHEGHGLIESVLFRAEVAHYKHQLEMGKDISWRQYLDELGQNRQLWNEVLMSYHDALVRLDFKPAWGPYKMQELIKQMEGMDGES